MNSLCSARLFRKHSQLFSNVSLLYDLLLFPNTLSMTIRFISILPWFPPYSFECFSSLLNSLQIFSLLNSWTCRGAVVSETHMVGTVSQFDRTDSYWTLYSEAENTFLLRSHGTFTKIDCFLEHETHPNKFKVRETIQSVLADHNGVKLDISDRRMAGRFPYIWKLNSHFPILCGSQKKHQEKFSKVFWAKWKWKHNFSIKICGMTQGSTYEEMPAIKCTY